MWNRTLAIDVDIRLGKGEGSVSEPLRMLASQILAAHLLALRLNSCEEEKCRIYMEKRGEADTFRCS